MNNKKLIAIGTGLIILTIIGVRIAKSIQENKIKKDLDQRIDLAMKALKAIENRRGLGDQLLEDMEREIRLKGLSKD